MTTEGTVAAADRFDARALNWRFVVPSEPAGLMLLPADGERTPGVFVPDATASALEDALLGGPYPAIAIADLGRWARIGRASPKELLLRAAARLEPGGWLYAGFANALYPLRPFARGAMRAAGAIRSLRRAGLTSVEIYMVFPHQRRPAYLISVDAPAELEFFLRRLFLPYSDASGWTGNLTRVVLPSARAAALVAPHRVRAALAPSFAIVAGGRP